MSNLSPLALFMIFGSSFVSMNEFRSSFEFQLCDILKLVALDILCLLRNVTNLDVVCFMFMSQIHWFYLNC